MYKSVLCMLTLFTLIMFCNSCKNEFKGTTSSSDGVEIVFESHGKGNPAVIFVHGWTNPRTIWEQQIEQFSEKYKTVALDLAGSGESGNNRTDWSMKSFSKDVISVVNELKLREVVLVGFSMGAAVVIETANQIPDKVKGIVLVDNIQNPEIKIPPQVMPVMDSVMMDLLENMTNEKLVAMGFYKNNPEENFERVKKMYPENTSRKGWMESLRANMNWMNEDCTNSLKKLQVPVHAINSDMQPTEVEIFKKYVPDFKAKIMKDVGHLVFWEKPEEFQKHLEESIQEFINN